MHRYQCKNRRIKKNQVYLTLPKEINKVPITDPKTNYELSKKEFRIIFLRKFDELQKYTDNKTKF